jgi:riboflavin biosynthesis pyrimidine reductase
VSVADVLCELHPVEQAYPTRPYVIASLISTVNGRATLDGTSGGLGDEADRAIFRGLRGVIDAILVGTGTLREEKYARAGRSAALREIRAQRGLAEEPTIMIVSRSLTLPVEVPLLADPASIVRLFTWSQDPVPPVRAQVKISRLDSQQRGLAQVLRVAREQDGIRAVVCEGGPTMFGALLAEDLIDELFLTMSPIYVSDTERALTTGGPMLAPLPLRLLSAHRHGDSLFLRYARDRAHPGGSAG